MNSIQLHASNKIIKGEIHLPGSKSESNRAIIIRAISGLDIQINNLADSSDTQTLLKILTQSNTEQKTAIPTYNAGDAGTTFRFLTAYFASQHGDVVLTGSERMKERPIKVLVDCLSQLGAKIEYLEKEGFPPLKIYGKPLNGGSISADVSVSSQYISALAMIAPRLAGNLLINFKSNLVSKPYLRMTLAMMKEFGVQSELTKNSLNISKQIYKKENSTTFSVESDWSAASYWHSICALSDDAEIKLVGLKEKSLQGDSITARLYNFFGVKTTFHSNEIILSKAEKKTDVLGFDFSDCPDIAQTAAVTATALGIPFIMSGLETLRIKETDRIQALINELKKINCEANEIKTGVLQLTPGKLPDTEIKINTYKDHRMALAFAPLALVCKNIVIENPEVVHKSYPNFWKDLEKSGILSRFL